MSYNKTVWSNGSTPINETNLNKIENELEFLGTDQKLLFNSDTGFYMYENQIAYLTENVSDQKNGIVLLWGGYNPDTDTPLAYNYKLTFVPKKFVELGESGIFEIMGGTDGIRGYKYVKISNSQISGDNCNTINNGTYHNTSFTLRKVYGV